MRPRRHTTDTRTASPLGIEWTSRQREVLDLLARGKTNPEIGQSLGVSLDGAKWHVSEVMSKLGVHSREEAAEYWREHESIRARIGRSAGMFGGWGLLKFGAAAGIVLVAVGAVAIAFAVAGNSSDTTAAPGTDSPVAATTGAAVTALTATGTPEVTAAPDVSVPSTPVTDATGMHPPGTRTGDPAIDRVIELVEDGDVDGLMDLASWTPRPCKETPNPSGFTVMCLPGMTEGTPRDAFFIAHVEGGWQTDRDWVRNFVASNVFDSAFLYAVHTQESQTSPASTEMLTHITFARSLADNEPPEFILNANGQFVQAVRSQIWRNLLSPFVAAEWLLPPVALSARGQAAADGFYAPTARTNYRGVDAFLDARASGDSGQVRQSIAFEPLPCTNTPAVDALPCAAGEPEGTLVPAIPVNDGCHGSMIREDDTARVDALVRRLSDPSLNLYGMKQANGGNLYLFMAPDLTTVSPTIVRIANDRASGSAMVIGVRTMCFSSIDEAFEEPIAEFGGVVLPPPE